MSLKTRLALTLAIAFITIVLIGGVLTFYQARDNIRTELQAARSVATNRVAQLVAELPATRDVSGKLAGFVRTFNGDRHVRVVLIDTLGVIRDESILAEDYNSLPEWFVTLLGSEPDTAIMPLTAAAAPITSVGIIIDPRNELTDAWVDLLRVFGLLVLFLSIAFSAIWIVADRALRPLGAIHEAFARIGTGDYDAKAEPHGPPEMRNLAAGLNLMTERLKAISTRNQRLSDRLLHLQDEERTQLARDLHDDVGPLLFAIDVDASGIKRLARDPSRDPETIVERAGAITSAAHEARKELRRILTNLRPGTMPGLGLKAAVEEMIADLQGRHPDVAFEMDIPDGDFGATIETLVHRAVREAVTNALRHGKPRRIAIDVALAPGRLDFSIVDDGGGFSGNAPSGGFGLVGMAERIEAAGGELSVETVERPHGVRIAGWIPLASTHSTADRHDSNGDERSAVTASFEDAS